MMMSFYANVIGINCYINENYYHSYFPGMGKQLCSEKWEVTNYEKNVIEMQLVYQDHSCMMFCVLERVWYVNIVSV